MSAAWLAALNDGAALWADAMLRACRQGGLALLGVWRLCRLIPRLSPEVRCWLWRLAFLKLLVAAIWSGSLSVPVLPSASVVPSRSVVPVMLQPNDSTPPLASGYPALGACPGISGSR